MMTDKPADKWIQKALEIMPKHDWDEPLSHHFARALEATDKAARERAASWHDNQAVEIEMSSKRVNGKMMTRKPLWHRQCAAAIRKGTDHE